MGVWVMGSGIHPHVARARRRRGAEARAGLSGFERCGCPGCQARSECVVPLPRSDSAIHSSDRALAVMARGLDVIASGVAVQAVGWYPVTARGEDLPGALVKQVRPVDADPEQARREYVLRYWRDDPFAPRHFLNDRRPLRTVADIGGRRGLLATGYGSELLPEFGVEYEAALYVRDAGRMLGAIRMGRTADDGDFDDRDLDFLRRAHLLLERSYADALEPPPALVHPELLAARGLTPREIEVAALAATGLTNPQIADQLLIGEATVKTHLLHAFEKLDIRTRAELASRLARWAE